MATNKVTHIATVINIFRDTVTVSVESSEACGGCASRSACSLGVQSNTRNILITTPEAQSYSVGEQVKVATRTQMGLMAVVLSYAVPALVLVVVLAVVIALGASEAVAALLSLTSVAIYYGALWLCRDFLAKKVSFTIEKL
ncbi:MAG: hypothetical protein E7139_00265 [Rikenellaceae bacterium]|nr:hypothetical protein [Rikenellaceae bacterium]